MTERRFNFNPGPAALPLEVLEQTREELVDFRQTGMSLMEMSHRSVPVEKLAEETESLLLRLLGLTEGYRAVLMGGGASTQFALVPLNLLGPQQAASYVLSGSFAEKAYKEAGYVGRTHIAASSKHVNWRTVPSVSELDVPANSAYLHITSNNTIEGSRMRELPDTGDIPLVADMTSDLLSRRMNFAKLSLIYAGAQKNLGPAGVTAVILKEDLLQRMSGSIPLILRYETFVKEKSLYNTPPVHAIYMMNLVLKWTVRQGGVEQLELANEAKADLLYGAIDASGGFYRGIIDVPDRSHMNVTWRMEDEGLERRFVQEAERNGFSGLAGHRSVGGLRASVYNAVPLQACKALAEFMAEFQRTRG